MSDFVDAIAQVMVNKLPLSTYDEMYVPEAAQATIDMIIARIPPLVWSEPSEDPYEHQMSGPYEVTDAGDLYFHEIERGDISTNLIARVDTIEAAKAAANAHHVAQLCKGMGIE